MKYILFYNISEGGSREYMESEGQRGTSGDQNSHSCELHQSINRHHIVHSLRCTMLHMGEVNRLEWLEGLSWGQGAFP